jgi:hypothetical protein
MGTSCLKQRVTVMVVFAAAQPWTIEIIGLGRH